MNGTASSIAASCKASSSAALEYSDLNLNNDLTTPINKNQTNERGKKGIASKVSITLKGNGSGFSISYDLDSPIL